MPTNRSLIHPGHLLLHQFMKPNNLSSYKLAKELQGSIPTVNEIVRQRRTITAEMALRLSRYFGMEAELWQSLQAQYDLERARRKIGKEVRRDIQPIPKARIAKRSAKPRRSCGAFT